MPTARHRTRRGLIAGGASAVATGVFAWNGPVAAWQSNRELLDLLRGQEQAQIAQYRAILDTFEAAAFTAAGLSEDTLSGIEAALSADEAHLAALSDPDQESAAAPAIPAPLDVIDALREAAELEDLAVAAYAFVIPELRQQRLIPQLLGIHSVDARHAAWLATLLGENPFPRSVDSALTLEASTPEGAEPLVDPALATPDTDVDIEPALLSIARELGLPREELIVDEVTSQVWPDTSLGCPRPDMLYAQVVTPGFRILVDVAGERAEFHADRRGNVVRCP